MLLHYVGELGLEALELVQLGELVQTLHHALLTLLALVLHEVQVKVPLHLVLGIGLPSLAPILLEELV